MPPASATSRSGPTPSLQSLIVDGARVAGVVVRRGGADGREQREERLSARRAVILAAGGFERNQAMREQYLPQPTDQGWTATPPGANTGDAIQAGAAVGGALHLMGLTWGVPTLLVPKEEKYRPMFVERSMPGCMVVNARGERFLNAIRALPGVPAGDVCQPRGHRRGDPGLDRVRRRLPCQISHRPLMPSAAVPDAKVRKSWWDQVVWKGETLAELAGRIGVDAQGLAASAARMSEFARTGKDLDFDRGGNVFDRYYGDVNVHPNPNLAPIAKGPFYAMKLWPGDIGTKGGLLTDREARVLDSGGQVIPGLYCVGNNSASVMGPAYPGAGSTLGPAMTFAYRAIAEICGQPMALERTDLLESAA
jgi:3-oxosteroid 1-dehydrogenase